MWCEIDLSALSDVDDFEDIAYRDSANRGTISIITYQEEHILINLERVSHIHRDLKFQNSQGRTSDPSPQHEYVAVWGLVFCDSNKIMKTIWSKNAGLINKIHTQVINFISEHKITGYFKFTDDDLDEVVQTSEETPF